MNMWKELNRNIKRSSNEWIAWARQHAKEIGDASIRHIERQDLLSERKQLTARLGEAAVNRFVTERKKTLRSDAPEISEICDRISLIDERLDQLAASDESETDKDGEIDTID